MYDPRTERRHHLAPWVLAAVLLGAWQAAVTFSGIPPFLLPAPAAVANKLWVLLSSPTMWPYIGHTLLESVGGGLLGAVVALPMAMLIHRSRWVNAAVTPFLGATQAIPAVAIAPVLALWSGYVRSCCSAR